MALGLLPVARRLPNFLVPDDGYFYAQIAYELATRGRSTFDGIHTTSGYHAPWALLLAAISSALRVVTLDKTIHLFAYLAVALSFALTTARLFFRSTLFRACAFVLFVTSFSLTEMTIAVPIMLGLLRAATVEPRDREAWLAFALPIVRIDLACVPFVLAAGHFPTGRRRAVTLAVATVAGAAVRLAAMTLVFGEPLGVAAWLKVPATFADARMHMSWNFGESSFQDGFFVAHLVLAGLAVSLRPQRTTWLLVLAPLSFLAMHALLSILRGWYWMPSSLGLAFALEHAMGAPIRGARRRMAAAHATVATLAVACVVHAVRAEIFYARDQRVASAFLSELRARTPESATIYTFDNPGFLGFFSGRHVVDGDGLVNDFAYARRLRGGTLAGYLEEERICDVVVADADADPVLDVAGLVLRRDDVELLFAIRRVRASQSDFALYRLDAARCAR